MEIVTLPTLKTGYSVRPCTMDDVEAVVALMNACAIKTTGEPDETVEQTRLDWQRPDFDQVASQRVVTAAEGTVVGWAEVHDSEAVVIYTDVYTHPDHENQGIGRKLLQFIENRAKELGAKLLFALSTQAFTYFQSKGGFSEGGPEMLPAPRREKFELSGRHSKILFKSLPINPQRYPRFNNSSWSKG